MYDTILGLNKPIPFLLFSYPRYKHAVKQEQQHNTCLVFPILGHFQVELNKRLLLRLQPLQNYQRAHNEGRPLLEPF